MLVLSDMILSHWLVVRKKKKIKTQYQSQRKGPPWSVVAVYFISVLGCTTIKRFPLIYMYSEFKSHPV